MGIRWYVTSPKPVRDKPDMRRRYIFILKEKRDGEKRRDTA
jgi:hypothetical protein